MSEIDYKTCPFCGENDFDAIGLKLHLSCGNCERYNNVPFLRSMFSSPPQPAPPATDEKEGEGEKVNINADGK